MGDTALKNSVQLSAFQPRVGGDGGAYSDCTRT